MTIGTQWGKREREKHGGEQVAEKQEGKTKSENELSTRLILEKENFNSGWETSKLNGSSIKRVDFSQQCILEKELETRGKCAIQ